MLNAFESLLGPLLGSALGSDATLAFVPSSQVPPGAKCQVSLFAAALVREASPPEQGDATANRESAHFGSTHILPADPADPRDFSLPAAALGQVAEVLTPDGRLLKAGDAFLVDGRTLRFFIAPGGPITVSLRGERSRGYLEKSCARIDLDLAAWAATGAVADSLLARSLYVVMGGLAERGVVDLTGTDAPGLSLRLMKPVVRLESLENSLQTVAAKDWRRSQAHIVVTGELETLLSLGVPEAQGTIRELALDLAVARADGGVAHHPSNLVAPEGATNAS